MIRSERSRISPLTTMRQALATGELTPSAVASEVVARANSNASRNTYIHFDAEDLMRQAAALPLRFPDRSALPALYGVPISLKDCFDLAGTVTTAGTRFYANRNSLSARDSAMASRLRNSGALITGKSHLHPLAYGITGQNPDFADCLQPRDAALLTGGSSSGAVASVQEGSALAAIGTDTGGSIRVPAALCGLTGYRASHALAYANGPWTGSDSGLWSGGLHLAPTFDTAGFFVKDPQDALAIADALFGVISPPSLGDLRIAAVSEHFLSDATPEVLTCYRAWKDLLQPIAEINPKLWLNAREILGPIQASEAAAIHFGHFDEFEASIAQRLGWGASLSQQTLADARGRLAEFRAEMAALFADFDLLLLPACPTHALKADEDQSAVRWAILRYTSPFSLSGVPVVSLPGEWIGAPRGTGIQLAAAAGEDGALLSFIARLDASAKSPAA